MLISNIEVPKDVRNSKSRIHEKFPKDYNRTYVSPNESIQVTQGTILIHWPPEENRHPVYQWFLPHWNRVSALVWFCPAAPGASKECLWQLGYCTSHRSWPEIPATGFITVILLFYITFIFCYLNTNVYFKVCLWKTETPPPPSFWQQSPTSWSQTNDPPSNTDHLHIVLYQCYQIWSLWMKFSAVIGCTSWWKRTIQPTNMCKAICYTFKAGIKLFKTFGI